jgi:S-layer protein
MSNATYSEVKTLDPATLADALYARDFSASTDAAVATTLVTNLGLASVAGLDNWVAAQLTAAGAHKGAKIVDLLNSFAQMSADVTYGAYATAFNTKVDAALAASQTTGNAGGTFAAAGTPVNATFALTAGADTTTLGAGDDTINATVATLGALDVVDGGAGNDTLNVNDTASVKTLGGATFTGIEKLTVSSGGSVGNAAASATIAAKQSITYDWGATGVVIGGAVKVTVGGVTVEVAATATATTIAGAIESILDAAYGTATGTAQWTSVATNVITVTANTAGVALPAISFAAGASNTTFALPTTGFVATVQANQVAADTVSANTFSSPATIENVISASTEAYVSAAATAKTTVTAGTNATVSGGTDVTITAGDSVSSSGAKGSVVITATAPSVSIAASSTAGWSAGAGVFVKNGTTVSVTEKAGTSSSGSTPGGNTTAIQIGANPSSATGNTGGVVSTATADGYPQAIGNLSSAPTGSVTTSVLTAYTDTSGYKSVKYGAGDVKIYMNGGTTASVAGASTVSIRDLQTIATKTSATATAAAGTSNLSTVNLTGVSGATALYTDALQNLSAVDSSTTVTLNSNTGKNAGALNLTVGNSTVTVDASNVTSVAVTGKASAYQKIAGTAIATNSNTDLTLTTPKATSLSFAGVADVTLASSTLTAMTAITDTSTAKVALGDLTNYTKLTSVDASAATGNLTATVGSTGNYGLNLKGGSGDDTITLKASASLASALVNGVTVSTSIDLGAGNDKLLEAGSATVGVGTVIDGGTGTDTVAATLANAGNGGLFKNFEIIDVVGATASGSLDASLLTTSTITGVAVSGNIASAGAFSVTNIAGTNLTVSVTDTGTTAGSLTATLATSTGAADTATVSFGATSSATTTSILSLFKTTGIESVSVVSGGTLAAAADTIANTLTSFEDVSNKTATITITGDKAFTLGAYTDSATFTTGVTQSATVTVTPTADQVGALKTIDGSAATGALTIVAGTSTTMNSGSYKNVYDGLVITGGAGADTLVNDAKAGVVNGGAGTDTIVVTGAGAVVDGGSGADTIVVGAAVSTTLTGDAGNDNFVLTSATVGNLSSIKLTTISDLAVGDKLTFTIGTTNVFNSTKADVSAATSLTNAYDVAVTAAGNTNNQISWFQYAGNTYVVNHTGSTSDLATTDVVVKITGLIDLSTATFAEGGTAASYLTIA